MDAKYIVKFSLKAYKHQVLNLSTGKLHSEWNSDQYEVALKVARDLNLMDTKIQPATIYTTEIV